MGRRTGSVFSDLRPYKFGRIEFRRTGRKLVYMQARMLFQKVLNLTALMNRMPIPYQHNRTGDASKQVFEKGYHFVSTERVTIGLKMQFDLAFSYTYAQGPDEVHSLMVFNACPNRRRLSARGPGPF